jgi:hypothetical protein
VSLAFKNAVEKYHAIRDEYEYEIVLVAAYERAVEETNGALVNRRGQAKGISDWDRGADRALGEVPAPDLLELRRATAP